MANIKDYTGVRFGKLTSTRRITRIMSGIKRTYYVCECDCGGETVVRGCKWQSGWAISCGCLRYENLERNSNVPPKDQKTRLHNIYKGMLSRCQNPNDRSFNNYGGRGIRICDGWVRSFRSFKEWALTNGYEDSLTIDRIDNSGDYSPENCRWVDYTVQNNNRRSNVFVEFRGENKSVSQWCRELDYPYHETFKLVKEGLYTAEEIFTRPHNGMRFNGTNPKKK